jgi:Ran GTPase-activating protein (RanGAP) involved in mRNA processing and transport
MSRGSHSAESEFTQMLQNQITLNPGYISIGHPCTEQNFTFANSGDNKTKASVSELVHFLERNNVEELVISGCEFQDKELEILAKFLQSPTVIENEGIPEFSTHKHTIKKLKIINCSMTQEGIRHLSSALECDKIIEELNLANNEIDAQGAKFLAEALAHNTFLLTLSLPYNNISSKGVEHLAEALKANKSLTKLDLESNNIHSMGALEKNNTLVHLNLLNNKLLRRSSEGEDAVN